MDTSISDLTDLYAEDPDLRGLITEADGHWLWDEARLDAYGYGYLYREGYMWRAHRWVWLLAYGLTDLPLDHLCRTRSCVNVIDHIEAVTTAENNRRKPVAEQCPQGHDEWVTRASGHRRCAACHREAERQRRAARSRA